MNSSANLISLSDSGAGPNLSTSLMNSSGRDGDFHGRGTGLGNGGAIKGNEMENSGTGLLIDFSDEVQVPVPQGILLQAEVDDTFGIFSMQQSSQEAGKGEEKIKGKDRKDEAAKLVESFTSGRKSDGVKTKMKSNEEEEADMETGEQDNKDAVSPNDSCESVASDQVTIVESDVEGETVADPGGDENEKGISDEKMNLTSSSNFSGGSDSEILDVNNLSSFSIPEDELDANEFIEDIKQKDMASSSVTAAIVNQIKMEMLQEEDKDCSLSSKSSITENRQLTEISRQSLVTSTSTINTRSRLSSASSVTSTACGSSQGCSQANNSVLEDAPISVAPSTTRGRLSSGNFGSPIRASYPLSNRYFMPTPNAKAPSAAASISRQDYQRDKLTDSLFSPSRTRVMLITGDSQRSPSRVPVRKSISAETLHYEHSTPARNFHRQSVKFSTPSAASRSRHSINIHQDIPRFPNIFGDDLPGMHDHEPQPHNVSITDGVDYRQYCRGRQSYASSVSSNTSLNTMSPPSYYSRKSDVSYVTNKINRLNLDDSTSSGVTAVVHPTKATAVIAPTNLSKPIIKPVPAASGTSTRSNLLGMPPKPKPVGHQGNYRPIASSSPKIAPSPGRPAANQTTPSRVRSGINVRSSGYGAQQNLNSTFGANQPLKSPNRATSANIKPAAIPKSLKTGVPSLGGKLELATKGGGTTTTRNGITALRPTGRLPVPGSTGIRRPTISTSTLSSAGNVGNKENKLSTAASSRIGLRQAYHRQ